MSYNDQTSSPSMGCTNQDEADRSSESEEDPITAPGRPAQSVDRPPQSNLWRRTSADRLNRTDLHPRELIRGRDSGRNMMGYFGEDEILRTLYPLRLRGGRTGSEFGGTAGEYPNANTIISVGTSLRDIIRDYPLHVWGDGLRLFIAEGWSATEIYKRLPAGTRHDKGNKTRPWNYMQKAVERQMQAMNAEQIEIDAEAAVDSESTPSTDQEPDEEYPSTHEPSISLEPTALVNATGITDPQPQDGVQPPQVRPTISQIQTTIQLEHELLFAAILARRRLIVPGFINMTIQDQHAQAWDILARHFAAWETRLMQILPVRFHRLVTIRHTGFVRELQILQVILDERQETAIHPVAGDQQHNMRWQAHQDLMNQIRTWRQSIESQIVRIQASRWKGLCAGVIRSEE